MLKKSTLARMRIAAAGALVLAGCGKQPVGDRTRGKLPTTADETRSPSAASSADAGPKPPPNPDPCPGCGMG